MSRNLSSGTTTQIANRSATPIILTTITIRGTTGGGTVVKRYASQPDTDNDYGYLFDSNEYRVDVESLPVFQQQISARGGLSPLQSGTLVLVNPTETAGRLSSLFDTTNPDRMTLDFDLVMDVSGVGSGDEVRLLSGIATAVRISALRVEIDWESQTLYRSRPVPFRQILLQDYPFAGFGNHEKPWPVIFGDMTRTLPVLGSETYDAAGSGDSTVPLPMTKLTDKFSWALPKQPTSGTAQVMMEIGGYPILLPGNDVETADGTTISQGDSNDVHGLVNMVLTGANLEDWVVYLVGYPDVTASNNLANTNAGSRRMDEYTLVDNPDILVMRFQGGAPLIGHMNTYHNHTTPVATDVIVRLSYRDETAANVNPGKYTVQFFNHANDTWDDISGFSNITLDSTAIAVTAKGIGAKSDLRSGDPWSSPKDVRLEIEDNGGQDGTRIYAAQLLVRFEPNFQDLYNDGLRAYVAQVGYDESSSALTDYTDGSPIRAQQMLASNGDLVDNPADITEVLIREKSFGMAGRSPLTAAGAGFTGYRITGELITTISKEDTTVTSLNLIGATVGRLYIFGDAKEVATGNKTIGYEIIRVESADDGTPNETLTVTRGMLGSEATAHVAGCSIYEIGYAGGDINIASMRAAAGWLRYEDDTDLIVNGGMEGTYVNGVAPGWTDNTGANLISFSATGKYGTYAQSLQRFNPEAAENISQTITVVVGTWYRLSFWANNSFSSFFIVTLGQSSDIVWNVPISATWQYFSMPWQADATSVTLEIKMGLPTGDGEIDAIRCVEIKEWKWAFAMTDRQEGRDWIQQLLPHALMSMFDDDDGRAKTTLLTPSTSVQTIDAGTVVADSGSGNTLSLTRRWEGVLTSLNYHYKYNQRADLYEGITFVHADYELEPAMVQSTTDGTTWLNVVIDQATAAAIAGVVRVSAATAVSVTSDPVAKTITFNVATDLSSVVQYDWIVLTDAAPGAGTTWIYNIVSANDGTDTITIIDQPYTWATANLTWTIVPNLHAFGGMIAAIIENTSTTVLKVISGVAGTATDLDNPSSDPVWKLASDSEDGRAVRDQTHIAWPNNWELRCLQRLVMTGQVLHETIKDPYIWDNETAQDARRRVLDATGPAYTGSLDTDLSTLAVEPGDLVTIQNSGSLAHVVSSPMTAHILQWALDPQTMRITYGFRQFMDGRGKEVQDTIQ